jgi:aminopeptidase-like protein
MIIMTNHVQIGGKMYRLMEDLYPICRSITGNGVRETLRKIQGHIPLDIHEVSSGTKVFDWTVPPEWNIRDAYVKNSLGERVIDFRKSNLHVLQYSTPVKTTMTLDELKEHLFTYPSAPDWIPYRTSYYQENWGFCVSQNQMNNMKEGRYEVVIDSSLENGALSYGELQIEGKHQEEVIISCHVCHPSLCNDNLSGIALATFLSRYLLEKINLRYSYRFLFIPGTIGSITWLSLHEDVVPRIRHGLVAACLGDPGKFTYKRSRQGNAEIDRIVRHALLISGREYRIVDFSPVGYDERQFCSPGFNLPVGCLMRTPHGEFQEYHTSADNLDLVKPQYLGESYELYVSIVNMLESNLTYINRNPKCEPQLGRRGLYEMIGGGQEKRSWELALLWVLNLSDGNHSLLDIAERSGLAINGLKQAADALTRNHLLEELSSRDHARSF